MSPSARQWDGIATGTVIGNGGMYLTVCGADSSTGTALAMIMVEPGILKPTRSAHFIAGVALGGGCANAGIAAIAAASVMAAHDIATIRFIIARLPRYSFFRAIDRAAARQA
jgi:hypothetical protein